MERAKRVCPHCGSLAWLKEIAFWAFEARGHWVKDARLLVMDDVAFFVACETCDAPSLYVISQEQDPEDVSLANATLLWPEAELPGEAPEAVQAAYAEAQRMKAASADAFAAGLRKCLEILCDENGVARTRERDGRTLRVPLPERLSLLAKARELPPRIVAAVGHVKTLGDTGTHELGRVRPGQAAALDGFFRALVEYVYVLPGRLERFERQLARIVAEDPQG